MNPMSRCYFTASKCALVVALATSSPAFAQGSAPSAPQDSADERDTGIADIIVTANKRGEESLQKVPIAISAYSGEQLETFGLKNFNTIDLKTPGLVFTQNSGTVQPYIRGIGSEFPVPGLEPAISVYLDDVYWQRATGSNYNLVDIDSVQVLKGPQGTLYGRNATGGAILLTTRNPEFNYSARASLEAGNLDHQQVDLVLNAKLSETFAVRVAGRFTDQDGYVKNRVTGINYGGYRSYEVRAKALYETEGFSALLTFGYNENTNRSAIRQSDARNCLVCFLTANDSSPATGVAAPAGRYETFQGDGTGPVRSHVYYGSLKLEAELGDLTFTSITGLRKANQIASADEGNFAGGPATADFIPELAPGLSLNLGRNLLTFAIPSQPGKDALQEFRLTSRFDGPLNFLIGINGQISKESIAAVLSGYAFQLSPVPFPIGSVQTSNDRIKTKSAAIYAEVYYDISEALKLTLGGRFNYDRKRGSSAPGGIAAQPPFTYRYSDSNFTPRAVLAWSPDADQNYYLSYSAGFKSGGFNYPTFSPSSFDVLTPETIDSFEVGAKNSFWSNRIRTTAALFYYTYDNLQVTFVDPQRGSVRENAGKGEGYGAEFDAQIAPTDALTLGLGYSYLHARYKRYFDRRTGIDLRGNPFTRAPEHTAYGSATLRFPLSSDWDGAFTAVARYTSKYDFNPAAGGPLRLDRQKAFTLVNLTGSFGPQDGPIRFGLYVNNLFDKFYLQNANTSGFGSYRGAALRRTYGGNVTVDF